MKNIRKKRRKQSNIQWKGISFVKKCNWLTHLGIKKHRDVVENGGGGGDMGGEG